MKPEELGFWNWAQRDPDRIALFDTEEKIVTFGELLSACNRVANGLRKHGLETGDGVAVVMPNCPAFYEIFLAALQTGLYFTPINHYLAAGEMAYVIKDSEAKALFVHENYGSKVRKAVTQAHLSNRSCFAIGEIPDFQSFAEFKAGYSDALPDNRTAGISMVYTSGTTGKPKGVKQPLPDEPPEGAKSTRVQIGEIIDWHVGDGVYLLNGPLHHSAPIGFSTLALHMGHTVIMTDKWEAEDVLRLIDKYKVTNIQMVPIHFHRLLKLSEEVRSRYDVSSIKSVLHSASPCPKNVKMAMIDWWGPVIYEQYGGTEGGFTFCNSKEWLAKPGTVGKPWPGTEIKILDDNNNELPPCEVGAVYAKTSLGPPTYFKDKEKTDSARWGDFFTIGEMGYLDEDGWLFLVDRKSDMLVSGGVNIYPAEIEAVLMQHPKIRDAAVIGVPNEEWGEEVKAILEMEPGFESGEEVINEVLVFCRENLAGYKIPRSVEFMDELPRGPNGKLYKRQLREKYWQGHEKRI